MNYYDNDNLILHGVIETATGFDAFTDKPFNKVTTYDVQGEIFGEELYNKLLSLNIPNEEGFVLKVKEPGVPTWMCKIKFSDYCRLHKLITNFTNISVWECLQNDTDFEPISAWAAKNQEVECIGIGHQYAFEYDIPKLDNDFFTDMFMKWYAPAEIGVGLHWHHFDYPILPPIIETPVEYEIVPRKIIVYLPFEEPSDVIRVLSQFTDNEFHVYGSGVDRDVPKHIHLHSLSRVNFLNDFASSCGVICGAGFELVSEALMLHKQILVKPLHGQMEQLSNATALSLLDYGDVLWNINERTGDDILSPVEIIGEWLDYVDNMTGYQLHKKANFFPNTAHYLTKWVLAGSRCDVDELSDLVWSDIDRTK